MTIYSKRDDSLVLWKPLNKIYGSQNKEGIYPLGICMVFIPNIFDTRFPSTSKYDARYYKSATKQKKFLENTSWEYINGI